MLLPWRQSIRLRWKRSWFLCSPSIIHVTQMMGITRQHLRSLALCYEVDCCQQFTLMVNRPEISNINFMIVLLSHFKLKLLAKQVGICTSCIQPRIKSIHTHTHTQPHKHLTVSVTLHKSVQKLDHSHWHAPFQCVGMSTHTHTPSNTYTHTRALDLPAKLQPPIGQKLWLTFLWTDLQSCLIKLINFQLF